MSVLSEVTQVEQRALLAPRRSAHQSRLHDREGQAAAIGAGVPINDEHAAAVVDIGGGTRTSRRSSAARSSRRALSASAVPTSISAIMDRCAVIVV
jgi:hypothetical protein